MVEILVIGGVFTVGLAVSLAANLGSRVTGIVVAGRVNRIDTYKLTGTRTIHSTKVAK
jgi:hypothetical protein